jgi:hypothetical protein
MVKQKSIEVIGDWCDLAMLVFWLLFRRYNTIKQNLFHFIFDKESHPPSPPTKETEHELPDEVRDGPFMI